MKMNEIRDEHPQGGQMIEDENHNYLQTGLEPVDATDDDNIQMLGNGEYQLLQLVNIVPSLGTASNNVLVAPEVAQTSRNNYTNLEQKEESDNISPDIEEALIDNDVSSKDDELVASVLNTNKKEDSNYMRWEDQRPMFRCNKCSYGAKKRYLLLRHERTHRDKCHDGSKTCNRQNTDDKKVYEEGPFATMIKKSTKSDDNGNDCDGDVLKRWFACTQCSYNTNKKYRLLIHNRVHTGDKPYTCKICKRSFTTGSALQVHVNFHNGVKNKNCKYCKKTFNTSGELKRHVRYKHTQEKPHKCTKCDYAAVERCKLRRHMHYHTGNRPYKCQYCNFASQDPGPVTRHLRTHTSEKLYKCDNCNASYNNFASLEAHKLLHNPSANKVYSCDPCPSTSTRKHELGRHILRMDFSDNPLKCKQCEETFSDQYSYRLHSKIHETEKSLKCQLCSFTAKSFTSVDRHMIIHTKQKPVEYKQYLNTDRFHGKIKTYQSNEKPYKCQKCKRTFAYKAFLIRHEAVHVNEDSNKYE